MTPTAQPGTIDYVTAVVVLLVAVLVAFSAAAVVRFYSRALSVAPRRHGLLLWHIVAVATATSGTWAMLGVGQLSILGLWDTPRAARLAGYAFFGVLTLASLFLIGKQQRRRVRSGPSETVITQQRVSSLHLEDDSADDREPPSRHRGRTDE